MMNMNSMNGNMQDALRQLQSNPKEFLQKAGMNVPDEMLNNPQAIVMHLIKTGQVNSPVLQHIMPMIRQMGGNM